MSLTILFTTKCKACGVGNCTLKRLIGDLAHHTKMTLEIHGCKEFCPEGECKEYKYDTVHHAIHRCTPDGVGYLTSCGDEVSIFNKKSGLTFQSLDTTCPECIKVLNKQIREENKKELFG